MPATKPQSATDVRYVIQRLQAMADPAKVLLKQRKFGIVAADSLGIYQSDLKLLAREIGPDDTLALALFDTGIYEARLLCRLLFQPGNITEALMERWVLTFENWEITDSFCMGFFTQSDYAISKAVQWARREPEFVKRAAFSIMASYGFANKQAPNAPFEQFLTIIEREASDERIYVKKAVNWALRNIGKRNRDLHRMACTCARKIALGNTKAAMWVAKDALRELEKPGLKCLDYPRSVYRK